MRSTGLSHDRCGRPDRARELVSAHHDALLQCTLARRQFFAIARLDRYSPPARALPGPPQLPRPALQSLALSPHLPPAPQPTRPTPPLLLTGLPSPRTPQTQMITTTGALLDLPGLGQLRDHRCGQTGRGAEELPQRGHEVAAGQAVQVQQRQHLGELRGLATRRLRPPTPP
jgi:hypothetical protein